MKNIFWVIALFSSVVFADENFSSQAWREIAPIYRAIRVHPFNAQLEAGTLPKKHFDYYSGQDSLYLTEFAKVLGTLANQLDTPKGTKLVLQWALDCLEDEKSETAAKELAPAAFAYTNFLLATAAYKSREELAAALLPCFWIYLRLAEEMRPKAGNPYRKWIDTYTSEKYRVSVEQMIRLTDELARKSSPETRAKMLAAFVTATRLEWYFWEGAYRLEIWKP